MITPEPDEVPPDPKAKRPSEEPPSLPEEHPKPKKVGKKGPMEQEVTYSQGGPKKKD